MLHDEAARYEDEEAYWRSRGVNEFINYEIINRAGALYPLREIPAQEVREVKQTLGEKGVLDACLVPYFFFFYWLGWLLLPVLV